MDGGQHAWESGWLPAESDRNGDQVHLCDLLPEYYLLKQLHREKRRADRTRSALSVVLFDFGDRVTYGDAELSRLCHILNSNRRETDIVGQIGSSMAIILVETGPEGTAAFIEKIKRAAPDLSLAITASTYPDHLFDSLMAKNPDLSPVHTSLFEARQTERRTSTQWLKRSFDLLAAGVGVVLLSPLMLATALLIKITSPGPVIFRQVRLGKRGVPFTLLKFRSMVSNADDSIHREYVTKLIQTNETCNDGSGAPQFWTKLNSDPRITSIGHFIRKTSIDELPQLFNVLRGELSLVGPRPPLPYEAEHYQAWHLRRIFESTPGITGIWQVEGGQGTTFDEMVRMDLRYVRTWSFLNDLKIIFRTLMVLVRRDDGSY